MAGNNAILDLIHDDHARIESLFGIVLEPSTTERKRKEAFNELRREITRHSMLEEEILYPRLKDAVLTHGLVQLASVHHATSDRLMNVLEYLPINGDSWKKRMSELRDTVVDHMKFEEEELRRLLSRAFSQSEISALFNRIRLARAA